MTASWVDAHVLTSSNHVWTRPSSPVPVTHKVAFLLSFTPLTSAPPHSQSTQSLLALAGIMSHRSPCHACFDVSASSSSIKSGLVFISDLVPMLRHYESHVIVHVCCIFQPVSLQLDQAWHACVISCPCCGIPNVQGLWCTCSRQQKQTSCCPGQGH